jgi:UDP-N-acetylmuramate dehydrogenase
MVCPKIHITYICHSILYMIKVQEKVALKVYNTFGIEAIADKFVHLQSAKDVFEFVNSKEISNQPLFIVGGGSNLLFVNDFNGLIVKPDIQGIEIVSDASKHVLVRCGAGVDWDSFVAWTVERNLGGIENLSLIPGTVGASPVQNIGAYGVEAKDVIVNVEGYRIDNGQFFKLLNSECGFDYRMSIFKNELKGKCIVTNVTFCLQKYPDFKTDYGSVASEIDRLGGVNLQNIRQAIINIRNQKLPDPKEIGNAGSFFKNPVVPSAFAQQIRAQYPDINLYGASCGLTKIPAAFLIEKCGWKGYRNDDAGVHINQPLVLVNYGNAKGAEILKLANDIQKSVFEKFNIELEMEVNVVG